jgi:hypothetical protein
VDRICKWERILTCSTTTQIYDLRTSISILLQSCAFEAVKSVRDPFTTAYHTLILIVSEAALIANPDESCGANIGITNGTFAIALVAETADGDTRLFPAHDKIAV